MRLAYFVCGFLLSASSGFAVTEIKLFSTGQGNTVGVKYRDQAMLIDAGSSEDKHTAAYHRHTLPRKDDFPLAKEQLPASFAVPLAMAGAAHRADTRFSDDSSESAHSSPDQSRPSKRARPAAAGGAGVPRMVTYGEEILAEIRDFLPDVVRTIIVTHPDKDHYNKFPEIFPETCSKTIQNIVLGGFADQYDAKFQAWLERQRGRGSRIVFTSTVDGSGIASEGTWPETGLARSYCSLLSEKTPVELVVEDALNFPAVEGKEREERPEVQILSMNAGHATTPGAENRIYLANTEKNIGSLVVRISNEGRSIILSGDAEDGTWNHIRAMYAGQPEKLQSDYLLLSHHGSKENGATTQVILHMIQPKAGLISVGKHAGCSHPRREILEMLFSLPTLYSTKPHFLSYFGHITAKEVGYKRKNTTKAIFSTMNGGTLSMSLNQDEPLVILSRTKESIYEAQWKKEGEGEEKKVTFSIDYGNVWSFESSVGPSMGDLEQALQATFQEHAKHFVVWLPQERKSKQLQYMKAFNSSELEETQHILLKPDKKRFYFLEAIEEAG